MIEKLKKHKRRVWLLVILLPFMFFGFYILDYSLVGNIASILGITFYYIYMACFPPELKKKSVKKLLIDTFIFASCMFILSYIFNTRAGNIFFFVSMFTPIALATLPYFSPEENEGDKKECLNISKLDK